MKTKTKHFLIRVLPPILFYFSSTIILILINSEIGIGLTPIIAILTILIMLSIGSFETPKED